MINLICFITPLLLLSCSKNGTIRGSMSQDKSATVASLGNFLNITINGQTFKTFDAISYTLNTPPTIHIRGIGCEPTIIEPNKLVLNMDGVNITSLSSFNYFPSSKTIVLTTDHPVNCTQNVLFKDGFDDD